MIIFTNTSQFLNVILPQQKRRWGDKFLKKKHFKIFHIFWCQRDFFMNEICNEDHSVKHSFNAFLHLFNELPLFSLENMFPIGLVEYKRKNYFVPSFAAKKDDLFAFVSGGILPYCINTTSNFDDIDIYISIISHNDRKMPEFYQERFKDIAHLYLFDILRLHFTKQQFCQQNQLLKSPREVLNRTFNVKNLTVDAVRCTLDRESKYANRCLQNTDLVHAKSVISLKHLAWNAVLRHCNPSTIFLHVQWLSETCNMSELYFICTQFIQLTSF